MVLEFEDAVPPLTKTQAKRKRVTRERASIEAQLRGLDFDRRELADELKRTQQYYVKKLTRISNGISKVVDQQRALLRKVNRLLEEDGKCSAFSPSLLTHKDHEHTHHTCELEFGHSQKHECACGSRFREVDTSAYKNCDATWQHTPHDGCDGLGNSRLPKASPVED